MLRDFEKATKRNKPVNSKSGTEPQQQRQDRKKDNPERLTRAERRAQKVKQIKDKLKGRGEKDRER